MNIHKVKISIAALCAILESGLKIGVAKAYTIANPINEGSFEGVVLKIANILTTIAIPLAVIFLIYAGFLFVSARGNEQQLKRAKDIFFYTVIGVAVLVGAYAIASAIVNFAKQL